MRTALIAALRRSEDGSLRAELSLVGRSVLAWQCALAQKLDCGRVICLMQHNAPPIAEAKQECEELGLEFHAITESIALTALLHAEDEIVMIGDGLVLDPDVVSGLVAGPGQATRGGRAQRLIATLPPEQPLVQRYPEDFERIDVDRSWAGFAIITGAQVQKLADFPPDGSAVSLLLRLALQARTPCVELDPETTQTGQWILASNAEKLAAREKSLVNAKIPASQWAGPIGALATLLPQKTAPFGLEYGFLGGIIGAGGLAGIGVALTVFDYPVWALAILTVAGFSAGLAQAWDRLGSRLWGTSLRSQILLSIRLIIDVLATISLATALYTGIDSLPLASLAPIAMGLTYLASRSAYSPLRAFWSDRVLQLGILCALTAFGYPAQGLAVFALAASAQLLIEAAQD